MENNKKKMSSIKDLFNKEEDPNPKLKPLSAGEMQQWNGLVDFIEKKGYKGSEEFNNRDTNLGKMAFDAYKKQNPNFTLKYEDVSRVQQGIQEVREDIISDLKSGKAKVKEGQDVGKDYEHVMANTSAVDGWMGSKTSSHRFPKVFLDEYNASNKKITDNAELGFSADKPKVQQMWDKVAKLKNK